MKTAKSALVFFVVLALVLSLIACTHNGKESEAPVTETTDKEQETEKEQETGKEQEPDGADPSVGEESPETEKDPENTGEPDNQDGDTGEQDDPETNSSTSNGEKSEEEKIAKLTERNIDPDKPMVALTFDDGPSPDYTEKILDLLAEHGAVATFFEVGNIAKNYPDLIRKELEYGCEVGSHTYSHQNLKAISEEEAQKEIDKAIDVFVNITGEPPTLLRPPYGSIGDRDRFAKAPVVTWSVDTEDWKSRDADAILEMIKVEDSLDGKVVLMHSIHGCTYDALDNILDYLDENGYQCVTVSELAYYKHGEVLEPGEFYGYSYWQ